MIATTSNLYYISASKSILLQTWGQLHKKVIKLLQLLLLLNYLYYYYYYMDSLDQCNILYLLRLLPSDITITITIITLVTVRNYLCVLLSVHVGIFAVLNYTCCHA